MHNTLLIDTFEFLSKMACVFTDVSNGLTVSGNSLIIRIELGALTNIAER